MLFVSVISHIIFFLSEFKEFAYFLFLKFPFIYQEINENFFKEIENAKRNYNWFVFS